MSFGKLGVNLGGEIGGYEQVRLLKNKDTSYQTYQPFDSKYFYMFGSTYYLNLYFRF
jgi:hypothetical protein